METGALLNHAWSILLIPSFNREGIPKGIFSAALFKSECFRMWLPFAWPCKMMTHPICFSTYLSCWHPAIPGTEAPRSPHSHLQEGLPQGDQIKGGWKHSLPLKDAFVEEHCQAVCSPFYFETIVVVVFPSLRDAFFHLPAFPRGVRQSSCVLSCPGHSVFRGCVHIYTYTPPS